MKIFLILTIFLLPNLLFARNIGETEITTEEGIEVFQNEKYYLLKKKMFKLLLMILKLLQIM